MPWTVISDATLEVGKALRALTMRNLRDNFAAMAAGDAGAPQIQTAAIATGAVTTAKIAAGNVTTATIADSNVTTGKIATGAVAAWNASLGTGEIGTCAFLYSPAGATVGSNYASGLEYSGISGAGNTITTGSAAGGTWRAMGTTNADGATLFLRIA